MTKQSDYFSGGPDLSNKKGFTAGLPSEAAAAEQSLKGKELKDERSLKGTELLAERELKIKELTSSLAARQKKVKELLEAVRYRDRKISKLGPAGLTGSGKVIGANVTDHSSLGVAEVPVEVPAQAKTAAKAASSKQLDQTNPLKKVVVPVKR